jgi:uncharacterized protein YdaU (DUF1376 family)
MGKSPSFQLYASDFLTDTLHLTNEEVGAYLRLLLYEWINGGIPLERAHTVVYATPEDFTRIWPQISPKFRADRDGILTNSRLELERNKQSNYREKQRLNVLKRWGKKGKKGVIPRNYQPTYQNDTLHTSVDNTPQPPVRDGGDRTLKALERERDFERFWAAYPRKVGEVEARRAWQRLSPTPEQFIQIIKALATQRRDPQWQRDGGRFIPHPSTWLNGKRWNDQPLPGDVLRESEALPLLG